MESNSILRVDGITKYFPGTVALSGVSFEIRKGEVHAIVGENGAGKSTLLNVISGLYSPDNGSVYLYGEKVSFQNPHDALFAGIGIVHQEMANCPHVTVAENIFMSMINNSRKQILNYNEMNQKAADLLEMFNTKILPKQKVSELTISEQQIVEIAKALSLNCNVILLDEPTAALTEVESETLFEIINNLKKKGISIIYISHRMEEIFQNCDRATILRDGELVETVELKKVDKSYIINSMVGRTLDNLYPNKSVGEGDIIFSVDNLSRGKLFSGISFDLRRGEILGVAGLVGSGRSELAKSICGLDEKSGGSVLLEGEEIELRNYREAISRGILYLTEDRKQEGLLLEMDIMNNVSALDINQVSGKSLINSQKEVRQAETFSKLLGIKSFGINQKVGTLSGGNQQKVLLAKLLSVKPKIIFMDEPTRGVDVGAKAEIHKLLRKLAGEGIGIIMISSELPEIIGMCERVVVMHEGRLSGRLEGDEITESRIMHCASGCLDEVE